MKKKIIYKDETANDVAICRTLCNRLMAHQAHQTASPLYWEILSGMNFENRLLPAFSSAEEKQLIVAYDGSTPVGYVFSTAEWVTEESRNVRPDWAARLGKNTAWLYPDTLALPAKIGDLNNLYVLPEYRGLAIGQQLLKTAMGWLRAVPGVEWLFVDVANGNPVAPLYEKYGFTFSHQVLGGLIAAYSQQVKPRA